MSGGSSGGLVDERGEIRGAQAGLVPGGRGRPDGAGRSAMGALAHHAVPSAAMTPARRPAVRLATVQAVPTRLVTTRPPAARREVRPADHSTRTSASDLSL